MQGAISTVLLCLVTYRKPQKSIGKVNPYPDIPGYTGIDIRHKPYCV
jgi:hypothetical protein